MRTGKTSMFGLGMGSGEREGCIGLDLSPILKPFVLSAALIM